MEYSYFDDVKTEQYFLSQCPGWMIELNKLDNRLKSNLFSHGDSQNSLKIRLIRDDSYYTKYSIELKIDFEKVVNSNNTSSKHLDRKFKSTILLLSSICSNCGGAKESDLEMLQDLKRFKTKQSNYYELTVGEYGVEGCKTCKSLRSLEEYGVHLLIMSELFKNKFITREFQLSKKSSNSSFDLDYLKSIQFNKNRNINESDIRFIYGYENKFQFIGINHCHFYGKNLYVNRLANSLGLITKKINRGRKVIYAGINTGFKDSLGYEIYSGDVIKYTWEGRESSGVVADFLVWGNWWHASLSELQEMEVIGNIFFNLDKKSKIDIVNTARHIGEFGFNGCADLNQVHHVRTFLASKNTPGFVPKSWINALFQLK